MSENTKMDLNSPKRRQRTDRRIVRTQAKLGDAMIELMQEQSFNEITVQQVLDRAGISRSTFYSHYRDKNDLFLSDVEEFLEQIGTLLTRQKAEVSRLFPVEELFSHIAGSKGVSDAINDAGKESDVRELAVGCFARSIEKRLALTDLDMSSTNRQVTAHYLAGSVFSLLEWWLRSSRVITPRNLDEYFHRMAWSGLSAAPSNPSFP